jgi:hypothetical protein
MKKKLEPMANIYAAPTKYGLVNILVSLHLEPDTVRALLRDAHAILDKMDAEDWAEKNGASADG